MNSKIKKFLRRCIPLVILIAMPLVAIQLVIVYYSIPNVEVQPVIAAEESTDSVSENSAVSVVDTTEHHLKGAVYRIPSDWEENELESEDTEGYRYSTPDGTLYVAVKSETMDDKELNTFMNNIMFYDARDYFSNFSRESYEQTDNIEGLQTVYCAVCRGNTSSDNEKKVWKIYAGYREDLLYYFWYIGDGDSEEDVQLLDTVIIPEVRVSIDESDRE